jgi:quinol monooxygenase YgiN
MAFTLQSQESGMVIERIEFDVKEGQAEAFLQFAESSRALFQTVSGWKSLSFGRGVENPSKMLFLVGWESVELHAAAPQTSGYGDFRQSFSSFIAGGVRMEHFAISS